MGASDRTHVPPRSPERKALGGVSLHDFVNFGDRVESCTALVEDDRGESHILDYSRPATEVLPMPDARGPRTRAAA